MTRAPATDGAPGLVLDRVALELGGRTILGPLTLAVPPGAVVTLMGPSGCGKSSLLAFLCGTIDPAFTCRGTARLDGRALDPLPPERRRVGILFQDDLLFPHMTVGENLAFGLPAQVTGRPARRGRVEAALVEAGLAGFADRDPATLSGGQRARVALMRILLSEPRALLLDEPFSRLDAALRDRFRRFVFDHARDLGLPALLVTHEPEDAAAAGGPVIDLARPVAAAGDSAADASGAGVREHRGNLAEPAGDGPGTAGPLARPGASRS